MNNKQIESLAANIVIRWHKTNEEPRLGELLLVELVYDMINDISEYQDKNGNFYTFIPKSTNNTKAFSIGYVEKEKDWKKNNGSVLYDSKTFIVKDYGIFPSEFGKHKFPFSPLMVKRWIYMNEVTCL